MTDSSIWVVLNNQLAHQSLKHFVDNGQLSEAYNMSFIFKKLTEKFNLMAQQHGGHIHLLSDERIVVQIPTSIADQVPMIVAGYEEAFKKPIATGIGLTFEEATKAAQVALKSGKIEMYDPEVHSNIKNDDNDVDRNVAAYKKIDRNGQASNQPPNIPSFDESNAMDKQMIQAISDQLVAQPQEPQQSEDLNMPTMLGAQPEDPAQQLQTNEAPQQPFQPRNLLEALLGQPMPEENHDEPLEDHQLSDQLYQDADQQQQQEMQQQQDQPQQGQPQQDPHADLKDITEHMTGKIPELMQLAQQDPKAFKQSMSLLDRMVRMKSQKPTAAQKSEIEQEFQELIKSKPFRHALGLKHIFPVGTRKGRKVKIRLPDGRTVWRSFGTGQLKDIDGTPISAKENHRKNKQNQQG